MADFTVLPLGDDQIADAYPLARMGAAQVDAERWADYVSRLTRAGGGVLGVRGEDGTLHGIAVWRIDESLRHGRTLRIELIVTFELNRAAPARAALTRALERLAQEKECDSLALTLANRGYADTEGAKAQGWGGLGLALDTVGFAKTVARPAVRPACAGLWPRPVQREMARPAA